MPTDAQGIALKEAYLRTPNTVNRYRFVSTWVLAAPLNMVWSAVLDSLSWPNGWRGVLRVSELAAGQEDGVGNVRRYAWRSRLPYTLLFDVRVVRIEPLSLLEGVASGVVEGVGIWRFKQDGEQAHVRYTWDVRTIPAWTKAVSLVGRPLVRWNHDAIMRAGGEGLARHLSARLLRNENILLPWGARRASALICGGGTHARRIRPLSYPGRSAARSGSRSRPRDCREPAKSCPVAAVQYR